MTISSTEQGQDVLVVVAELLHEIADVPVDNVRPEAHFRDDLDVDSLLMVEFSLALEEKYAIEIPEGKFEEMQTVGALVGYLEQAKS
ncbi:acyl carrier protein [Streptomyces sp. NPDC059003]|uniref:acyl carrier protein n=2 Tax=unclassified Streptomyces TaxID=2593676 RepID=UPI0036B6F74C